MRDIVDTEVSLDRETHQVLVSIDAPGVSVTVSFDPWIDDYNLSTAIEQLTKELDHEDEIGPNAAVDIDLAAASGHASRSLDRRKQAEKTSTYA